MSIVTKRFPNKYQNKNAKRRYLPTRLTNSNGTDPNPTRKQPRTRPGKRRRKRQRKIKKNGSAKPKPNPRPKHATPTIIQQPPIIIIECII